MEKPHKSQGKPRPAADRGVHRDSRGTHIDPAPGPGPKDAGKGAIGKHAKDRLAKNH
jgi:hypothetical protein